LCQPLCIFVSWPHAQPSQNSNQVFVQNPWSPQPNHQNPLVHSWQAIEDLWVANSYTHITLLPEFRRFWSCCPSSEVQPSGRISFWEMDTLYVYLSDFEM
jgi:hypothetical protein